MVSIATSAFTLASDAPIHVQLAARVRRLIGLGQAGPGDRLPAARTLAESLGIHANTVLRAYRDLARDDLVELRRGRGATITSVPNVKRLYHLVDGLVTEARRLGVSRGELIAMLIERM